MYGIIAGPPNATVPSLRKEQNRLLKLAFPILNAWLRNLAFQCYDNIKILLELPFIFSIFPICRLFSTTKIAKVTKLI
jgi:hypothetical protein